MTDDAPVRWLVLVTPTDPCGPWVYDGLRGRGFDGVRVVTVDALVYSTSVTHRVSSTDVSTEIVLYDGTVVGPGLQGTLNRTTFLPLRHLEGAPQVERDYAVQELYALFTSVLHGLPGRTVNRAGPRGLAGPALRPAEWAVAAGRAGLAVVPQRSLAVEPDDVGAGPYAVVYVVGRTIVAVGDVRVPAAVADGCRRLATDVGVELLALTFHVEQGQWLLAEATCDADLRPGGEPLLDALADHLR